MGRCFCGAVEISIEAEPLGARLCWCRDCQRLASGSATVNVLFPPDAVHLQGPVSTIARVADSGNRVERGFCASCGSQIFSKTVNVAELPMRIRAGILDDPELVRPSAIIWAQSAPSWAILDPALPHHPGGPETQPMAR
ncbi:GFA family protein [Sphingobium sp. DEHP117]|uniref:GFA family protein n=1 Tax=Sphingobium sp. DEHP117 TaxID=2993436 RepID=UPI0027D6B771|nr:GFA family protein [Sphingobium sp. DEHP117]MDQ4419880.1 GFA family protein [Sphingobium sp. DEHP117]